MSWFTNLFKRVKSKVPGEASVRLDRVIDDGARTIGKLYIDGEFMCYTLEDTRREVKIKHKTCIPKGRYKLALRHSPKFSPRYKHDLIWIKDVPGFEYVLIHVGNTETDTSGCVLVGESVKDSKALVKSHVAYNKVYPKIADLIRAGDCWLEINDKVSK